MKNKAMILCIAFFFLMGGGKTEAYIPDGVSPDWTIGVDIDGQSVYAEDQREFVPGEPMSLSFLWPTVGTQTYIDVYQGEIFNAVRKDSYTGGVGSTYSTSSVFVEEGKYFIVIYNLEWLCTGGDFCFFPARRDVQEWFESGEIALGAPEPPHWGIVEFSLEVGHGGPEYSNVLFIPGTKASRLYKNEAGEEKRLWEPTFSGRNDDVRALFLADNGESTTEGIYIRDALSETLLGINIYKSLFEFLDTRVEEGTMNAWKAYPYDWRFDVADIVTRFGARTEDGESLFLIDEIESLAERSQTGKVTIIAHSNGGLIGKILIDELVLEGKEHLVDYFVLVGSPQAGTPEAVAALLQGYDQSLAFGVLLSEDTARAFSKNLIGAYILLPNREYFETLGIPVATFGESGDAPTLFRNVYGESIDTYDELKEFVLGEDGRVFSLLEDDVPLILNPLLYERTEYTRSRIEEWEPPETITVVQLIGWGVPTLYSLDYSSKTHSVCTTQSGLTQCTPRSYLDIRPKETIDGDGTVISASAAIEEEGRYYVNLREYNRDNSFLGIGKNINHANIFEIPSVLSFIDYLVEKSTGEILEYIEQDIPAVSDDSVHRISVHSPVNITVENSDGARTGSITVEGSDLGFYRNDIPNSVYRKLGEGSYITLPTDGDYSVTLDGTGMGFFTLEIETIHDGVTTEHLVLENLPVTESMISQFTISDSTTGVMSIDYGGDGVPDTTLDIGGASTENPFDLLHELRVFVKGSSLQGFAKYRLLQKSLMVRSHIIHGRYDEAISLLEEELEEFKTGVINEDKQELIFILGKIIRAIA